MPTALLLGKQPNQPRRAPQRRRAAAARVDAARSSISSPGPRNKAKLTRGKPAKWEMSDKFVRG